MVVDVATEVTIARPREIVADYAVDPDHIMAWYQAVESMRWETEPPLQVGTRLALEAHFVGRHLAYTLEVREHTPGEHFRMVTVAGPIEMDVTYTFTDTPDGGTLVRLHYVGGPRRAAAKLAGPLLARALRRALQRDLTLLKARVESA